MSVDFIPYRLISIGIPGELCQAEFAQQVLKAVAAEQHAEKLAAVHEVDIQPLHAVLVILCAQVCIAQNLLHTQTFHCHHSQQGTMHCCMLDHMTLWFTVVL